MAKVSYDNTGSQVMAAREYDIAAATAIAEGQFVKLSAGKVVSAAAGETTAILGLAAENHPGTADAFNLRANGTKIRVWDSPAAAYESVAPRLTATGGTTTTLVVNNATLAVYVDNDFTGGYMKLVAKAAASTNTDPLGTAYPITGFTAATKTFTTTKTAGGAVTAGDVFEIYPPVGFAKGNFDSGIAKYDLSATAALAVKTAAVDTAKGTVTMEAALHQHGNKQA